MHNFKQYLQDKRFKHSSITNILGQVSRILTYNESQGIASSQMSYNEALDYVRHRKNNNISTQVIQAEITAGKHYWNYLLENNTATLNPFKGITLKSKKNTIQNHYSEQELEVIYQSMINHQAKFYNPIHERGHQMQLIVLGLLIYQGLTPYDLNILRISDFSLERGEVELVGTTRINSRNLKLDAQQIYPLIRYFEATSKDKLFTRRICDILNDLNRKVEKVTGQAIKTKDYRTSRVMIWLKQHNLRRVQHLAGFKYLSSLQKYQQQEIEDLKKKLEGCFPI